MLPRRRLLLAVALAALVAAPAGILAGLCIGNACRRSGPTEGRVPFCSLPKETRSLIAAGFRDGRSPHILAAAGETPIIGASASPALPWPSIEDDEESAGVPLVFAGSGIRTGVEVPDKTTLDAVAPTLAKIIALDRPHPGVRSGELIPGLASGETPPLVVLVAWKGVTSRELERRPERWPVLRGLMEDGAGTLDADPGSLPTDPAAILTTIGTGSLPRDHGITGSLVRNDQGEIVKPWTEGAPFSVLATLGDDLDRMLGQGPGGPWIGLVATDETDQGLIGGNWYLDHDQDDLVVEPDPEKQATAIEGLLASGYGADANTPHLLAVAMEGPVTKLDQALGRILVSAELVSEGSFVIAVTSTGSGGSDASEAFSLTDVEAEVQLTLGADVIEAVTPGGFFLDQEEMTRTGLSDDRVVNALRMVRTPDDRPLFPDVFPAIAVTFARYC